MHIGELAEKTGLSLRTLRHYDEIGLVEASGRTEGGFRLYIEGAFGRLMLIRRMKPLGFSLEEMAELLRVIDSGEADAGDVPATEEVLDSFIAQAQERREAVTSR